MIRYYFDNLHEMGNFFAKKAADIRSRIRPDTTASAKRVMQAEAHAYEQAAEVARDAIINPPFED